MKNERKQRKQPHSEAGRLRRARAWRYGALSVALIAGVAALAVALNTVVGALEKRYAWSVDLSSTQRFSISEETRALVRGLPQPVRLYTLFSAASQSDLKTTMEEMLRRYAALGNVTVENIDLLANPAAASRFQLQDGATVTENALVVANADESRVRVVPASALYDVEIDYQTQRYTRYDFVGEQAVNAAIRYVVSSATPVVYLLQGHGEPAPEQLKAAVDALTAANMEVRALSLADGSDAMAPGDTLLVVEPQKDLSEAELALLRDFLAQGGSLYYAQGYGTPCPARFAALLQLYGLALDDGLLVEDVSEAGRYYRNQLYLMPALQLDAAQALAGFAKGDYVVLPQSRAVRLTDMKRSEETVEPLLLTSAHAYIKGELTQSSKLELEQGDEQGQFCVAAAVTRRGYGGAETRVMAVGNGLFLTVGEMLTAYDNKTLLLSPMQWLAGQEAGALTGGKSLAVAAMNLPDNLTYQLLSVLVIAVIPAAVLLTGLLIWRKRRRL